MQNGKASRIAGMAAAILALFMLTAPADAQTLTPDQMRSSAVAAITNGQPALALQIADALLTRDPQDVPALILKARAARDLAQFDLAELAAAQAWALSTTPSERYASARVMAQILSSQDKRTRAQLWLRRAAQHAPDAETRQVALRDFRYVSARNRWNTQLNISVAPNSNINNGSVRDNTQIYDFFTQDYVTATLGGAARALSGVESSLGATLRYRVLETESYRTDLLLLADTRRYRLSEDAKLIAPTASASDFALDSLNLGLVHRWRAATAPLEYQIAALAGATRYGGAHYSNSVRLSTGVTRAMTAQTRLNLSFGADATRGPRAPHADTLRLGANLQHRHASGTLWSGSLSLSNSTSDSESADFREARLELIAEPTWTILGADPGIGVSFRARDYDSFSFFSPDGRRDNEAAFFVTLNFAQAEYYGFMPTLTLEASRTSSSIGLFEADRFGLQLGVRSAF
jgi:hypothetical protein